MATQKEILERLDTAATNAENATDAYNEVLTSEGEQDIPLVDGTTTPNLNKRVKNYVTAVKSVQGKTGEIVLIPSDIMSIGSRSLNATAGLDPVPELLDDNGVRDPVANAQAQALLNNIYYAMASSSSSIDSIDDLKSLNSASSLKDGDFVHLNGYRSGSTDGSGFFVFKKESTEAEIDGIIVKPTSLNTGRFKRVFENNAVNVLHCGAYRDGSVETHTHIKAALQYAINNNMPCYAPSGLYLVGGRIDPTLTNGKSVIFYGDGDDQTWFKERDGLTLQLGKFNMMFYFLFPDGATGNLVKLSNFSIDKNGRTSPAPANDIYLHEQSHCIAIASGWNNSKIKNVLIENVVTKDKTGGGIVLTQGYVEKANGKLLRGVDYQHVGGERGDFEFQSVVTDLDLESCSGRYIQCEPNIASAPAGMTPKAVLKDCTYDLTEFTAYVNTPSAQSIIMDNHTAKTLCLIRWAKLNISNSALRVTTSGNTYWEGTAKGSVIENSKITVGVNTTLNTFDSFYPRSAANVPTYLKLKDCIFNADSTANGSTTGYAVNNAAIYSGAQGYLVEFENVEFDSAFEKTANCYANGNFVFRRCKLAGRSGSPALTIGGYSTYYANVTLDSNDLSQLAGTYVQYSAANTLWSVNYLGSHDFAKSNFTSSNLANTEACAKASGYFTSDALPTLKGILGWRVKINKPPLGTVSEFICTTTSSSAPVYQLNAQAGIKKDTTANRPTGLTASSTGLRFLDTTLSANGRLITYNGTSWVDSTGAAV